MDISAGQLIGVGVTLLISYGTFAFVLGRLFERVDKITRDLNSAFNMIREMKADNKDDFNELRRILELRE